jgi:hypothetical protein
MTSQITAITTQSTKVMTLPKGSIQVAGSPISANVTVVIIEEPTAYSSWSLISSPVFGWVNEQSLKDRKVTPIETPPPPTPTRILSCTIEIYNDGTIEVINA